MDKFKELKEKIEKRDKEFREELRPFAIQRLKSKVYDLKDEEFEKLSEEDLDRLINPTEEAINKRIEEMITNIKNKLKNIPEIQKAVSLDELITIICSGNRKLLKDWRDYLEKKGSNEVCELLWVGQYMSIMYVPEDVEELIREYQKIIATKAREFKEKEQ